MQKTRAYLIINNGSDLDGPKLTHEYKVIVDPQKAAECWHNLFGEEQGCCVNHTKESLMNAKIGDITSGHGGYHMSIMPIEIE